MSDNRTYTIRVQRNGDVRLSCPGHVEYSQTHGLSDLECREPYHKAVRLACMDVASAMRALDETIESSEAASVVCAASAESTKQGQI